MSEKSGFYQGLFTGTLVGGLLGAGLAFFLSPKSGPENRKMVADKALQLRDQVMEARDDFADTVEVIFGEVNRATMNLYADARELFARQLETFQDSWDDIDRDKYMEMVDKVMGALSKNKKNDPTYLEKLKTYWTKNWKKISSAF